MTLERRIFEPLTAGISYAMLPFFLIHALSEEKLRSSLVERFARGKWSELADSKFECDIWFHAASVGEVGGVMPVIQRLQTINPELKFLITTTSNTGRLELEKQGFGEVACLLPVDLKNILRKVVQIVRPQLFVVTETEIWPNLFYTLDQFGVPVVLINGRISDYSFPTYSRFSSFIRPALQVIDTLLVQTELDAQRFVSLGVLPDRIKVVGSTKYDQPVIREAIDRVGLLGSLGLSEQQPIFVAGSVREREDQIVIDAYLEALKALDGLQMVIAPRHPERFEEVAKILTTRGIDFNRRSITSPLEKKPVVLLDTLGELRKIYSIATVSFVGGSLIEKVGGHNPLEPAGYACPVVVGPHTSNVRDAVQALKRSGGLSEVNSVSQLSTVLLDLCLDSKLRELSSVGAYEVWKSNQGATEEVVRYLNNYLIDGFVLSEDNVSKVVGMEYEGLP